MKKVTYILFFILITVLSINVKAEKCSIVSGTGKNIGDEIACGSEHFYVISSDENEIKMLAKYNLYLGMNIYAYKNGFSNRSEASIACEKKLNEISNENYMCFEGYYYYFIYEMINSEEIKQDELAIGAHGESYGSPEWPHFGVFAYRKAYAFNSSNVYNNFINFTFEEVEGYSYNKDIGDYLSNYTSYLSKEGIEVKNIELLTLDKINDISLDINQKSLPLDAWSNGDNDFKNQLNGYNYSVIGDLKNYFDDSYDFLWSTTYWLGTFRIKDSSYNFNHYESDYSLFIDTLGYVCNGIMCDGVTGAGIRPVITIAIDQINYNIYTKTDGNGKVIYEKNADGMVKFELMPNDGYVIDSVKVTDVDNNVIEFKNYSFTMPNANVTIEAKFKKDNSVINPNTDAIGFITGGSLMLLIVSVLVRRIFLKKKKFIES